MAPDGSGERRLTDVGGWPVWWPDGRQVAYLTVGPNGGQQIWSVSVDGGTPQRLESLTFTDTNYPFDIARDGRRIIASRNVRISRRSGCAGARYVTVPEHEGRKGPEASGASTGHKGTEGGL
jgi:Tol biopolymer transport system component